MQKIFLYTLSMLTFVYSADLNATVEKSSRSSSVKRTKQTRAKATPEQKATIEKAAQDIAKEASALFEAAKKASSDPKIQKAAAMLALRNAMK